ncbi:MAG: RluA family pseudouridine synthase [Acidimicrobiales bacterium]
MTAVREQVPGALAGQRIDRVVAMVTGCSRATATAMVLGGAVRIDGVVVTGRATRLEAGAHIEVEVSGADAPIGLSGDRGVEVVVVHDDDDVIVVDKPAGLVVHPGSGNRRGTLVQGLLARYPEMAEVGDPDRPGIVHRLDKGTSGLLMVARTAVGYEGLVAQLSARTVSREYRALVQGHPASRSGMVDAPIGRSNRAPTRMTVSARGRDARTRYEVEATFSHPHDLALLRCHLDTGRTHQIRVHLAAIGHPIVGDRRYGAATGSFALGRPFLHAATLGFLHPVDGTPLSFVSTLPPDLGAVLADLA